MRFHKSPALCLDLSRLDGCNSTGTDLNLDRLEVSTRCAWRGRRQPPLLPHEFSNEIVTKCFTRHEDQPLVARLYRAQFEETAPCESRTRTLPIRKAA